MYYNHHYNSNIIRFKLMCEQWDAVKREELELEKLILHMLYKTSVTFRIDDEAGFRAEHIAKACGCRIRYYRIDNANVRY